MHILRDKMLPYSTGLPSMSPEYNETADDQLLAEALQYLCANLSDTASQEGKR